MAGIHLDGEWYNAFGEIIGGGQVNLPAFFIECPDCASIGMLDTDGDGVCDCEDPDGDGACGCAAGTVPNGAGGCCDDPDDDGACGCGAPKVDDGNGGCECPSGTIDDGTGACCPDADGDGACDCPAGEVDDGAGGCCPDPDGDGECGCAAGTVEDGEGGCCEDADGDGNCDGGGTCSQCGMGSCCCCCSRLTGGSGSEPQWQDPTGYFPSPAYVDEAPAPNTTGIASSLEALIPVRQVSTRTPEDFDVDLGMFAVTVPLTPPAGHPVWDALSLMRALLLFVAFGYGLMYIFKVVRT
ncbi:MAG: hypothetical protein AAGD07_00590 [Planctomycetota bacterium]